MKIKSITHLDEQYKECDLTTSTGNFYVRGGDTTFLIHNSPAIVCGKDPSGRFFVASKSAFAKNPKINYTVEDIQRNHGHAPGLVEKLTLGLQYLPELDLQGIYQLDYMFDDILKVWQKPLTVDGAPNDNSFITFQPNTILYAVEPTSPYGAAISRAKIGVAIHIEYEVVNEVLRIKKYSSNPNEFKPSNNVFVFNVLFEKPANSNTNITGVLMRDIKSRKKSINALSNTLRFDQLIPYTPVLKTYINKEVAKGEFLDNPQVSVERFIRFYDNGVQKRIDTLKLEKNRLAKQKVHKENMKHLRSCKKDVLAMFKIIKHVADMKNSFIKIFNELTRNSNLGQYYADGENNWVTASPEGYAVSRKDENGPDITKLVQRKEFSAANFNNDKFGNR